MKKKPTSKSAFFNPRALVGFALCLSGILLALLALGVLTSGRVEARPDAAQKDSDSDMAEAATAPRSGAAKLAAKRRTSGAASRATVARSTSSKVTDSTRATIPDETIQVAPGQAVRVIESRNELNQTIYSISTAGFDVSPPLTKLATLRSVETGDPSRPEHPLPPSRIPHSSEPDPVTQVAPTAESRTRVQTPAAPTTGFNFLGQIGGGSWPPDNNGSVGNDQFVETVNTSYQVWTLNRATSTVTSVAGPSSISTLWSGFTGGNCSSRNDGDPIVLFDKVANRWLISQFTSAAATDGFYYQCVAISTTANAAGTYYRYAFAVPGKNFGDYPHFGVWTDAYYMMAHAFTNSGSTGTYAGGLFGAMDRTKMLAGDASATWQVIIDPTEGGHVPADLDGFAPPPGGAPGIFVSLHDKAMYLYRMKVDFTTPANTARTLQAAIPIAAASAACGGGACIPQPGSTVVIDSLADRLMARLAYRNFVDHESLVVSHSVDPGITGVVSGVRWYDFRISGQPNAVCSSYPCTYQQGTVADVANGRSRWMPSISMDGAENILVGYSASGKTTGSDNHSIRYTARAKDDPLGTMTAPEATIFTGTRNIVNGQTTPERWGDYTSVSIDPADDCTFWHVNEYYLSGGSTGSGNGNWKTRVASARFPAGTAAGQCAATTCTTRPASAPTIGTASASAPNQVTVSWTGISPTPGSYAIERAVGPVGSEGLYQPLAAVSGASTSFNDTTVQGGITYSYRVLAATDSAGKCQALVRSGSVSTTATGACSLTPVFAGATSASSVNGPSCAIMVNWSPATSSCPLTSTMRYNIFRGTTPDFVPSVATRIATCAAGPSSYVDSDANLISGNTYYYVVRAEDNSTGHGGECGGGNEESNSVVVSGTAYGSGTEATPGTWTDSGGDGTAFLQLNSGTTDQIWRFVKTSDDAGANHTAGGAYAYRTAGPTSGATYNANACSAAETPTLTVGATSLNLTYWERHQLEYGWDGVALEYSRNDGAWTDLPAPSNSTGQGCLTTDITTDYTTLGCTGSPPVNACAYPASKGVITGPLASGTSCSNWTTSSTVSSYGRRCHFLTGLTPGDTIKFRWRFTSDPGSNYAGFYLDDIAVTNITLPAACNLPTAAATNLAAASASGSYGGTTTLSATLTSGGNGVNGESVSFSLNGTSKGTATTNASGVATLSNVSLSGIAPGNYPSGVSASFAGDSSYSTSSGTNSLTVSQVSTTVTLGSDTNPSTYGTMVSFTATVTSGATGTVTFMDGASTLGTGTLSNGSATYATSSLSAGSHSITAVYGGDANYTGSTSSALSQVVNAAPTPTPTPAAPVLASAGSRMDHGGTAYDISMPLSGTAGIECRNGGGDHTIVLSFDSPVNGGSASVTVGTGSVNGVSYSGNDMLVSLTGVGDQQTITVTASNVTGTNGGVLASASVSAGFLIGDTTGDGSVDVSDVGQTKSQSGQDVSASNFREDVTANGSIDVSDVGLVKSKSGNGLP